MTPIMNAVRNLQDSEVIAMLVDAGADPQAKNNRGQTAAKLAESSANPKLSRALRPKHIRNAPAAETIDGIVDLLSHVAGANTAKNLEGMAQGALKNLFGWSGEFNENIEKKINWTAKPPQTVEEYYDRINDYTSSSELGKVFKPDDNFLQTVSQKAMELRNDKSTPLSKPENVERLVKLALYKPILFCDDSGSMGDVNAQDTSASNQFHLEISDGVKNARKKEVEDVMRTKRSTGITRIATKLVEKVLNPYIYAVLNSSDGQFQRPLLILILTNGAPCGEYDDEFENAIAECKKQLKERDYPGYAVIFQISQIGSDAFAKHFLTGLSARAKSDTLYCTGDSLDSKLKENEWYLEEWLLKLLVAPIYRAVPGEEEENLWN
ncbi:hypothetical protein H072_6307 [Dactylellina haptotyla CBS 200.50]|uniref:Uncharacterized protein n=1 Tax=Dactylellina haptotyla (strain CBS 200.50) TaxID=1284197 RepID=S8A9Z3_DACHA|nr:hypothetical protein H072_6307 [Dactylellina haptotyla CBS 200.50]